MALEHLMLLDCWSKAEQFAKQVRRTWAVPWMEHGGKPHIGVEYRCNKPLVVHKVSF